MSLRAKRSNTRHSVIASPKGVAILCARMRKHQIAASPEAPRNDVFEERTAMSARSNSLHPVIASEAKQSCDRWDANTRLPRRQRLIAMTFMRSEPQCLPEAIPYTPSLRAKRSNTRHSDIASPKGVAILCTRMRKHQIAASPEAPRNDVFEGLLAMTAASTVK